jgi:hypothetical protein
VIAEKEETKVIAEKEETKVIAEKEETKVIAERILWQQKRIASSTRRDRIALDEHKNHAVIKCFIYTSSVYDGSCAAEAARTLCMDCIKAHLPCLHQLPFSMYTGRSARLQAMQFVLECVAMQAKFQSASKVFAVLKLLIEDGYPISKDVLEFAGDKLFPDDCAWLVENKAPIPDGFLCYLNRRGLFCTLEALTNVLRGRDSLICRFLRSLQVKLDIKLGSDVTKYIMSFV